MLNWNSSKIINLYYPEGAGGNFVGCCLAFSPSVIPHDRKLSSLSLEEQQIELFNRAKNQVFDFGCGMISQYGVLIFHFQTVLLKRLTYPPETVAASYGEQYMMNTFHLPLELEKIKQLFPNSKTVQFRNFRKILSSRNYRLRRIDYNYYYQKVAGPDWQDLPYEDLEEWQQSEIKDLRSDFEYYSRNKLLVMNEDHIEVEYYLDADNLLHKDSALEEIKKLYDYFKLENFNESLLSKFYDCWSK